MVHRTSKMFAQPTHIVFSGRRNSIDELLGAHMPFARLGIPDSMGKKSGLALRRQLLRRIFRRTTALQGLLDRLLHYR